ncbi:MAG: restriction endonuclease [Spirochaetaceae bacterium]|jgi:hypothetical protein|nr:restriction endonuclease [Spirochaetaceae bacterium]
MNTVKKGNDFEDKVFKYINTELLNDRLHVSRKRSKAYQKKDYFSKDRQATIITDISIETFLPDASDYSLLTVIECKDYNSAIPVNDIEEFHSKVQQIAGDNVKAIFVTNAVLQKSALNYAKSKGIAVIRYLPDNQVKLLLQFMTYDTIFQQETLDPSEFNSAFLNQEHQSSGR